MPVAEVNGQRLYYEDTGGGGPAVLFSHGLLMDRRMFDPQVEALRDGYRCVAWDARGHGDTSMPETAFTYWDSADDLRALAASLGIDRAFLVGMSQGGFLSQRLALRDPGFVRGLALIDTQAGPEPPEMEPQYRAMAEVWQEHGLSDQLAEMIAAIIMSPGYAHNDVWIERWKRVPHEYATRVSSPLFDREDLHDRLPEITAPAIVFHGEMDAAIPMELAERLAGGLRGCEGLVRVPGAGHASNLSHPEAVNGPLRDFLDRHSG